MEARALLGWGSAQLPRRIGIPDPQREARWLLAAAWEQTEVWVLAHDNESAPAEVEARFRGWIERRSAGEPAEHLTGRCSFWGREFRVSPDVLVPRPETELLVDRALALPLPPGCRAVDIGTGSGCIALTLALERPGWQVTAADRNPRALVVAKHNADHLGTAIRFVGSDLGTAFGTGWELVVANLPYIPAGDLAALPLEVHRDPPSALDGGADGLDLVRRMVADLGRLLRPSGRALLELYEGQAPMVADLAAARGLGVVGTVRDSGGCERVLELVRQGC